MSERSMFLHAATNVVGSECDVDLGVTESEWDKMTEEKRQSIIGEFMSNVVETWVEVDTNE
jgi:hypothetical protein